MADQTKKDKTKNERPVWQDNVERVASVYFGFCRRAALAIARAKRKKKYTKKR